MFKLVLLLFFTSHPKQQTSRACRKLQPLKLQCMSRRLREYHLPSPMP